MRKIIQFILISRKINMWSYTGGSELSEGQSIVSEKYKLTQQSVSLVELEPRTL